MGSSTHKINDNHKDLNDLTQIRGIGVVRRGWLHSLGIRMIADLAKMSVDDIAAQAKRDGRMLSHSELADWIAQARSHCAEASLKQTLSDWEAVASFEVTYQTRQINGSVEKRLVAYHLETDTVERWGDFETDLLPQWMRDRVEAALPVCSTPSPVTANPMVIEITQLRMLQPNHMHYPLVANESIPVFSDVIQMSEPFALEVSMHLAGLSQDYSAKRIAYRVQCLARNLATGVTDKLGEVTTQVGYSKDFTYQVLLPSLRLLQTGFYRLKILVTLQHAPEVWGYFKVPLLQVTSGLPS